MAVSNKELLKMTEPDKASYLRLRQSLDSFTDVVLAEFDLGKPGTDRKEICDFVSGMVQGLLRGIATKRQSHWREINFSRAEDFERHAADLKKAATLANASVVSACPPGFVEVNGICVPI